MNFFPFGRASQPQVPSSPSDAVSSDMDRIEQSLLSDPKRKVISWSAVWRALHYVRPYWRLATVSASMVFVGSLVDLLTPWPLKILIDDVLVRSTRHPAGHAVGLLHPAARSVPPDVGATLTLHAGKHSAAAGHAHHASHAHSLPALVNALVTPIADHPYVLLVAVVIAGLVITIIDHSLGVVDNYVNTKLSQYVDLDFRCDMFRHVQRLSIAFHDRLGRGNMLARMMFSMDTVGQLPGVIPGLARSIITIVGMFWIAYILDSEIALLTMIVVPVLAYGIRYYSKRIVPELLKVNQLEAKQLAMIYEAFGMLRVIAAFAREDHEYQKLRVQGEKTIDARIRLTVKQTLFSLGVDGTTATGAAIVLGLGAYHVLQHRLTIGDMLVLMSYVSSIYSPMQIIIDTLSSLLNQMVILFRCFVILDTEPEVKDLPNAIVLDSVRGDITLDYVSFAYGERERTLENISFHVEAGQSIAIVGPTGAGKSTLVSLISRFYDPSQGRIYIDGHDLRDVKVQSLRSHISMVLQDAMLFNDTIANNIRYGRLDATMDEIIEAAKDAGAHDFIMRLPEQYETEAGDRGTRLSGGERQRVAVARAFLKDAPILVLDEPTSSIDSRTEAVVLDALDRLMVGRTTFMIAHRLSTIRHSDCILVVDDGRIVEQGTHEELLEFNGLYRQLHELQSGNRREGARKPRDPSLAGMRPNFAPLAVAYEVSPPLDWLVGETRQYEIGLTNRGTDPWYHTGEGKVQLSVQFGGLSDRPHESWASEQRFPLERTVLPGASHRLTVNVTAPVTNSVYVLRHRLVQEKIGWARDVARTAVHVRGPRQVGRRARKEIQVA